MNKDRIKPTCFSYSNLVCLFLLSSCLLLASAGCRVIQIVEHDQGNQVVATQSVRFSISDEGSVPPQLSQYAIPAYRQTKPSTSKPPLGLPAIVSLNPEQSAGWDPGNRSADRTSRVSVVARDVTQAKHASKESTVDHVEPLSSEISGASDRVASNAIPSYSTEFSDESSLQPRVTEYPGRSSNREPASKSKPTSSELRRIPFKENQASLSKSVVPKLFGVGMQKRIARSGDPEGAMRQPRIPIVDKTASLESEGTPKPMVRRKSDLKLQAAPFQEFAISENELPVEKKSTVVRDDRSSRKGSPVVKAGFFKSIFKKKKDANTLADDLDFARSLELEGQVDEALNQYEKLAEQGCEDPLLYHRMAVINDTNGKYSDAILLYQKSLQLDPENEELLCDLGYRWFVLKDYRLAERYYRNALGVNKYHTRTHNNIAILYAQLNNRGKAMQHFRLAGLSEEDAQNNFDVARQDSFE